MFGEQGLLYYLHTYQCKGKTVFFLTVGTSMVVFFLIGRKKFLKSSAHLIYIYFPVELEGRCVNNQFTVCF